MLAVAPPLALVPLVLAHCGSSSGARDANDAGDASTGSEGGGPPVVRSSDKRDLAVPGDLPIAVDASNAFALDLYSKLAPTVTGKNFLTSPLSASLALTMTYAGALGTTASQMASALHLPTSGPSIFDAQNALTQALAARGNAAFLADQEAAQEDDASAPKAADYQVSVVNEVWGQTGYPWEAPFLATLAKSYGTGVYTQDFESDPVGAEAAINAWVSTETEGKIDPLLAPDALTDEARMVLVNAIHLKLPWQSAFDPSQTEPSSFTRSDGTKVMTDFLNQTFFGGSVGYAETAAGQFVSVPLYGKGVSVVFALPKTDLAALTASLTQGSFTVPESTYDELVLSVPKLAFLGSTFPLGKALKALGMTDAFSPIAADFKGVCAHPPDGAHLHILEVYQRATIDVDEAGVEAAGATAVILGDDASAGDDAGATSVTVTIDQPFLVAVVDATGAILFLGQINDPTSTGS